MNKLTVAITGSNGYIGSYFKNYLREHGYSVIDMSRKPTADIYFELGQQNDLSRLQQVDILIHCAYDFSLRNYDDIKKINIDGALYLFEQAHKNGVKKIINLSSMSAFETSISDYGRVKFQIEQLAKQFNIISIRPGVVFNKNPGGIIGSMNKLVKKLPIIPLIGKGDQVFFPCHIEDLSGLIYYVIENDIDPKDTLFIAASEDKISFKKIIQVLADFNKRKALLIPLPYHLIYAGLKMAEFFKINTGLRCDSLKYMKHYEKHPDFKSVRKTKLAFRSFDLSSLST